MTPKIPYLNIVKIAAPIVLILIAIIGHRMAVSSAYKKGAASRQEEVQSLTSDRDTALQDVETLQGDLGRCRDAKAQSDAKVDSLNSRIIAQADTNAKALEKQAEQNAQSQKAQSSAMNALAQNNKANADINASLLQQMKGVRYEYDKANNRCIIRGGGSVLLNAANGETTD